MLQLHSLDADQLAASLDLLRTVGLRVWPHTPNYASGSLTVAHRTIPPILEVFPDHQVDGQLRPVAIVPFDIRADGPFDFDGLSEMVGHLHTHLREGERRWVGVTIEGPKWNDLRLVMDMNSRAPFVTLELRHARKLALSNQVDLFNRFAQSAGLSDRIQFTAAGEGLAATPTDDQVRPHQEFGDAAPCNPGRVYYNLKESYHSVRRKGPPVAIRVLLRLCGAGEAFLRAPLTGVEGWAGSEAEAVALSVHHGLDPFEETRRALNALGPRDWHVEGGFSRKDYGVADLGRLLAETVRFRLSIGDISLSDERGECELSVAVSGEDGAFTIWIDNRPRCDVDLMDDMFDFRDDLVEKARAITDDISQIYNP